MHRMTKACAIPAKVKREVWERDGRRCIFCGTHNAAPVMHFIPRSHGGLGIPQNIATGCFICHAQLDNSAYRKEMLKEFEAYLKRHYPNWDPSDLIYRKWG